jgi:galactofuranosylgalactofuranosylrhamnosyl-N-acetylglucosaminyl-diphospho-decaprenol beta-1,5/1,6-galactofuranosyltransferase
VSAIQKAGLPLPFFIHVDDVEYGVRLRGCGVPTIPFPGIAVWHAPFYAKNSEWQRYYGIRNRLIMASAHPGRFQLISATVGLLWWMLEAAAVHNYLRAALIGKAVQDFLRGPRLFTSSASDIHDDVMEIARGLASPTVPAREAPAPIQQARAIPSKDLSIAVLLVSRILGFLCLPQRRPTVLLLESQVDVANVAFGSYVKTDAQGRYFLLYRLNRSKLLRALLFSIRIWAIYVATRSRVARSWNAEIPRLRAQPFWSRAFTGVPEKD